MCSFDSQGFVFVFSQDLVIGLQSVSSGKEKLIRRRYKERKKKHVQTNVRFKLTCQGNLCLQQLKYPARDFPSRRVCFRCEKTHTHCVTHSNSAKNISYLRWKSRFQLDALKSMKLGWGLKLRSPACCRNIAQLQTYNFTSHCKTLSQKLGKRVTSHNIRMCTYWFQHFSWIKKIVLTDEPVL